jgi:molybdate transport system ATP-binding protein
VALATVRPVGISIRNILEGVVVEIQPEPETAFAETLVDVGGTRLRARLTRAAVADLELAPGKAVFALIKSIAFDRRGLPPSATTPAMAQPKAAR